jgi:signal transduction histidine kinase/CheY-like chemotaxis protein
MSSADSARTSVLRLRESILQNTLWATAILASIAYVPSVIASVRADIHILVVADTIGWAATLVLALWRKPSFKWRSLFFIGCWILFGLILLWLLGPIGPGTDWLLVIPVLSALFFGYTGAFIGIGCIVLVTVAYGLLLALASVPNPLSDVLVYDLFSWAAVSGTLIFLAAMVSVATARLLDGLEQSLVAQEEARQQIAEALNEREQLQEQLLHSQKLSALGTMASGIAHDFNNLLVPILMASEAARDDARAGSAQQGHLDNVILSAERARDLIRRLLSVSQNQQQKTIPVAIAPVLRETAALLRSSMPSGIQIDCQIENAAACVMSTPDALQQITMNLGTNACLAVKADGGRVILRQRRDPTAQRILIEVSDTGPGIPAHVQPHIFEPFFTTRAPGEGTGLGLSIVHRLVSDIGGRITFSSIPGQGTTFSVSLPEINQTTVPAAAPGSADAHKAQIPSLRILVVDDEELVRATLRMILQNAGHQIVEADSAAAARAMLEQPDNHFDVLVTDQTMPGQSGSALAQTLATEQPDLPVIIISGKLDHEIREQLKNTRVIAILDKPFNRRTLLDALALLPIDLHTNNPGDS